MIRLHERDFSPPFLIKIRGSWPNQVKPSPRTKGRKGEETKYFLVERCRFESCRPLIHCGCPKDFTDLKDCIGLKCDNCGKHGWRTQHEPKLNKNLDEWLK